MAGGGHAVGGGGRHGGRRGGGGRRDGGRAGRHRTDVAARGDRSDTGRVDIPRRRRCRWGRRGRRTTELHDGGEDEADHTRGSARHTGDLIRRPQVDEGESDQCDHAHPGDREAGPCPWLQCHGGIVAVVRTHGESPTITDRSLT
ncbi:hypothetical protein F3K20_24390 [Streptomyces scabiei]|nr:hypothetical protein [Streptomyces sp. LBUM 1484]MBP5877317.1 hypothetical protein [Streptomyces sp. LBUM 1477]MBP5885168.1 hypothetical protein [Streptomyces sp. LBUM 1487]MBP5892039.1 hypothetical protein [Streptomyces sp. LBUM 1481]MBP5901139.1 hypothetical protein [Streptomyces sp. LBUM 1488]MBP5922273.1 hypothetical protein [Streptomyces sp. LBUM 1483]QTU47539.1 hypothetical protein F3K20_24390 [Streptomyces sp. LBUM 1482]QTU63587.1 hypothetical protein F3K22_23555 [Streptomyces sp. 